MLPISLHPGGRLKSIEAVFEWKDEGVVLLPKSRMVVVPGHAYPETEKYRCDCDAEKELREEYRVVCGAMRYDSVMQSLWANIGEP